MGQGKVDRTAWWHYKMTMAGVAGMSAGLRDKKRNLAEQQKFDELVRKGVIIPNLRRTSTVI